jgi:putative FmdB family regulatory protein
MPVYVFRCDACQHDLEVLRPLGDVAPPVCPLCDGPTRQKLARVAVKYDAFGFTSTDKLVGDTAGRDMKSLRRKAEEIADS